jgi:hypothetical protein
MFEIKNVKISLKIDGISLNTVLKQLEINNILYERKNNYIIIKHRYIYVIFIPKSKQINHVNITKIPILEKINDSITTFCQNIFSNLSINVKKVCIDNLTSTFKLNHALILSDIIKDNRDIYNLNYNNEKFPGLFIKFGEGTLILFYTGNVIAVGCKNEQNLKYLFDKLKTIVHHD